MTDSDMQDIMNHVSKAVKSARMMAGSDEELIIKRLRTEVPPLDEILGGGLPFRRITCFSGEESGGKSFLSQLVIASAQRAGLTTALIDVEHSFDPVWANNIGVDTENLIYSDTSSGEEAIDVAVELIKARTGLVVVDSLAGLLPLSEKDADMEQKQVGTQARLINQGLRKITQEITGDTIVLLINQQRDSIGMWAGMTGKNQPGGRGLRHFAGIILWVSKGPFIKDKDKNKLGFHMRMFTEKNKTHRPQLMTEIPFLFSGKLDLILSTILRAIDLGIITQKGPYYQFEDFPNGKMLGRQAVEDYFLDNEKSFKKLSKEVAESE